MIIETGFFGSAKVPGILGAALPKEYPIGTVAYLREPYAADRGTAVPPREVTMFRRTSNGRWTSYPGNDVSFATFAQLNLAAPVERVEEPAERLPEPTGPTGPATSKGATGDVGAVPDAPADGVAAAVAKAQGNSIMETIKANPGTAAIIGAGLAFMLWRLVK